MTKTSKYLLNWSPRVLRTLVVGASFTMLILLIAPAASATEFHVSARGSDTNDGSLQRPFKTILPQLASPSQAMSSPCTKVSIESASARRAGAV